MSVPEATVLRPPPRSLITLPPSCASCGSPGCVGGHVQGMFSVHPLAPHIIAPHLTGWYMHISRWLKGGCVHSSGVSSMQAWRNSICRSLLDMYVPVLGACVHGGVGGISEVVGMWRPLS